MNNAFTNASKANAKTADETPPYRGVSAISDQPGRDDESIYRKSETLRLDKIDGVTTIWSDKQRRAPIPKAAGPCFQRSDEAGMHVSVKGITTKDDLAVTLQKALEDAGPTPPGLNARHPDFAAFDVKIGRPLGREVETVEALKAAEADKSAFCLENDNIGTALLSYLREVGTFEGTAELAPKLIATDKDLEGHLSAKRVGKRLNMRWPHPQKKLATARKTMDRKGFTVFSFKANAAEFAEFQTPIP
ncbi:MAG TPA: hypothetical protein VFC44_24865 [Candidatus Saccharimonadales bacterium]|nr:hypothetical protein [Candidatus Saccharimonadales bacterium]